MFLHSCLAAFCCCAAFRNCQHAVLLFLLLQAAWMQPVPVNALQHPENCKHGCNLFRNCKHAASRNSANNNNTTPAASRSACSSFSSFSSCSVIVCCSMPLFLLLWLHRCIHFPGCSGTTTACIIVVASSIPEQHAAFPHFLFSLPIV